ncbi:MAG: tRNA uridine-5-carboxymethylaminomethyl(34) synthesis enzyme MnmG [Sedimentisphaerales bacterium]|jgi:tRNA uridine 5-carboxymethylaminomethyl modification enzyme|nr:tRNA uridine-5-carboxymethylaminomethyl(34) synthesis enzyme MnmG [Sedimentisphaerales bacterium]HNY78700.1 tRNA uridine-5-carboxymethylaminomethyl(34) synthesis enzyme MnmG [Sedimentisphaerales bacterium]HOC63895.1 tRNA uridine-5-carboxymethylaminomethyl(34) synthesis enzyme MnmG [Sedimentisphaerales bacterium]HOH64687.1 tRNA uridine-5-carboxymethylaminomethyl(34) synthesis enzyme MnmG [Sedimentisphaerales bacterium]HPY50811.1 tRNA uridine-5-carboxymethylaminomethyl(34) synthesis enzyme Mnm
MKPNDFDCVVVGAGHAGIEAAHAAARIGARTCLITLRRDTIAKMSCNPAIGGLGKGQIACEVDALGGLMGLATDATGIQFRLLNRSKGPAVRAPRAQADKYRYQDFMRAALEQTPNLTIVEAMASEVLAEQNRVRGVRCQDGGVFFAPTMVLTTGTFLRGLMHVGSEQQPGGRLGEPPADELSESLERLGLDVRRLKTGTPVRLDASTCDLDTLEIQYGDGDPVPFSFMTDRIDRDQTPCWITYTNERIHQLIRANLDRAPLYTGQIRSTGPRYCPSIETKILRFADKDRHQVFLEPEDEARTTIYCNGISTSLPREVQEQMLRLMPGTERARIVHYAYAIEYDYCPPTQLQPSLETRRIGGLFLAGQINGTSGYEEAAGQGILAGINATRKLCSQEPLVLRRDQAYIGVLIDDLMTRGIDEPYRMFTSRAEHRLALRYDNADRRLTEIGRTIGLVDDVRYARFQKKLADIAGLCSYLQTTRRDGSSLWDLLRRPNSDLAGRLAELPEVKAAGYGRDVIEAAVVDAKYEGYLVKQQRVVALQQNLDSKRIPADFDYTAVTHLRCEAREKLSAFKPATLGHASRISGITPADITVLQICLKKLSGPA